MKPYTAISISVFTLVALSHLLRLIFGWAMTVQGVSIPMWVSAVGVVVPAGLAIMLYREMKD
jgi:hypothetical protein